MEDIKARADEFKLQAEQSGYCILSKGEDIDIKGGKFKVHHFDNKTIMLECPKNIYDLRIKLGEELNVNKGRFIVEHYGTGFMKLRGISGSHILNQHIIDEYHKQEIKKLQEREV